MASYVLVDPQICTTQPVPYTNNHPPSQRRALDPYIGGGSLAYCSISTPTPTCSLLLTSGFTYPNGLIRGADGLIYVPNVITGEIHVVELSFPGPSTSPLSPDANAPVARVLKVIKTWHPLDNLSLDKSTGDIYAAAFTDVLKTVRSFEKPFERNPPSGVLRIRKLGSKRENGELEYEVTKVLEDNGSVLPGATVAVHDSGVPERFFLGGTFCVFGIQEGAEQLTDCVSRRRFTVYHYLRESMISRREEGWGRGLLALYFNWEAPKLLQFVSSLFICISKALHFSSRSIISHQIRAFGLHLA